MHLTSEVGPCSPTSEQRPHTLTCEVSWKFQRMRHERVSGAVADGEAARPDDASRRPDVFISYAREDTTFVDVLVLSRRSSPAASTPGLTSRTFALVLRTGARVCGRRSRARTRSSSCSRRTCWRRGCATRSCGARSKVTRCRRRLSGRTGSWRERRMTSSGRSSLSSTRSRPTGCGSTSMRGSRSERSNGCRMIATTAICFVAATSVRPSAGSTTRTSIASARRSTR